MLNESLYSTLTDDKLIIDVEMCVNNILVIYVSKYVRDAFIYVLAEFVR